MNASTKFSSVQCDVSFSAGNLQLSSAEAPVLFKHLLQSPENSFKP